MAGRRWAMAMAAMALATACSSSDDGSETPDAGCAVVSACPVDLSAKTISTRETLNGVCALEHQPPSSGLYNVCLVAPDGSLYVTTLKSSTTAEGSGWTHSSYGGTLVPSTLSADDEQRCGDAFAIGATAVDGGTVFCQK